MLTRGSFWIRNRIGVLRRSQTWGISTLRYFPYSLILLPNLPFLQAPLIQFVSLMLSLRVTLIRMCTRMTSQCLDIVEANLAAIKLALQSHESSISTQSTKLNSLVSFVSELSKFVSILCDEIHVSRFSVSSSPLRRTPDNDNLYSKRVDLPRFLGKDPVGG